MQILFLIEGRGIGGNERVLDTLFKCLMQRGIGVVLVCPEGSARQYLTRFAIKIFSPPATFDAWSKLLLENRVTLSVGVHGSIVSLASSSKANGIPCLWMYGHPYSLSGWTSEDLGIALSLFDRVISQSHFLASTLSITKDRVEVIPNGVDLSVFQPLSDSEKSYQRSALGLSVHSLVIGYPARWAIYKRHAEVLESFQKLKGSFKDLVLLLIGLDGDAPLKPMEGVVPIQVDPSQMPSVLGTCDVVAFPAKDEGYGCAIAESLAMGLPAMIRRSAGHEEFADVGPDFFYSGTDQSTLTPKIFQILSDFDLRKKMSVRAREYAYSLDSRKYMKDYIGLFERFALAQ